MTPGLIEAFHRRFYRWLGEQPSWLQPYIVIALLLACFWALMELTLWVIHL